MTCSTAWSVCTRLRGTLCASSSAILRSPCSTASRAMSIVSSCRTSSSVRSNTDIVHLSSEPLLQPIESALELLATRGVGEADVARGAEGVAGDEVDVGGFEQRQAE